MNKSNYGQADPQNKIVSLKYYNNKGNLMGQAIRQAPRGSARAPIMLPNCFPWLQSLFEKSSFTTFDGQAGISDFKQQSLAFAIARFSTEIQQLLERKLSSKKKKKMSHLTNTDEDRFEWSTCSPTGHFNTLTFIKDEHYIADGPGQAESSRSSRKPKKSASKADMVDDEPASITSEDQTPPEVVLWRFSQTLGPTESEAGDVAAVMNGYFVDKVSDKRYLLSAEQILAAAETNPPFNNDPSEPHWWDDARVQRWLGKIKKDLSPLWPLLLQSNIPTSDEFNMVCKKVDAEPQLASTRDAFNDDAEEDSNEGMILAEDSSEEEETSDKVVFWDEEEIWDDESEAKWVREMEPGNQKQLYAELARICGRPIVDYSAPGVDEALETLRQYNEARFEEFKDELRRGL